MPQNSQNTIIQTALKYYNQFRSVITEAHRWIQITVDAGIEFKVETTVKERYHQLLNLITIDLLNNDQQHTSGQYSITLSMTQIINSYFNKYPMVW